jgi:8-oxo-dGTP pyrophosphatase MutT (NUDIX family)
LAQQSQWRLQVREGIRSAATVVLWREAKGSFEVLMGMRGQAAVFMPSKYVFPGGAVDPEDETEDVTGLQAECVARLALHCPADAPSAGTLARAALRELQEETGLQIERPEPGDLRFVFRAVTPPGRTRRFDARFFLCPAAKVTGDIEGFVEASTELSHLHWIELTAARALDLPFITEVVLSEISAILRGGMHQGVPFFDNSGDVPTFRRL